MNTEHITKAKTLIIFAKAKKSIAKTIKMVESSEPCVDIMKQNSGSVALLQQARRALLERRLIDNLKKYN